MELDDDDIELTGGIRSTQNRTSPRRRYLSTTVHDSIMLRAIREQASRLLDVLHNVELFLVIAGVALSVAKKVGNVDALKKLVHLLKLILAFVALCEGELDVMSEVEIDHMAIRTAECPPLVVYTKINRKIDDLEPDFAQRMTRFTKPELCQLLIHLRLPTKIVLPRKRYAFTGEELLIVCLSRIATGDPWCRLIPSNFGGGLSRWSDGFEWFINYLFETFYHKITGNSMKMWVAEMDEFRRVIHKKVTKIPCEIETWASTGEIDAQLGLQLIDIPFDQFYISFLIDDTNLKCCRPGSGPFGNYHSAPRRFGAHYIQRAFYSGYFKEHGIKYQNVLLPNGLYGSVWGASTSYNDMGILNMSGLIEYLYQILTPTSSGGLPCGLGDGIFSQSQVLMSTKMDTNAGLNDRRVMNRLHSVRQPVELQYGHFFNSFRLFKNEDAFKLFNKGEFAYRVGIVGFFLLNCRTCLRGSVVNAFFDMLAPTLEDYIPLDEELEPFISQSLFHHYNY